MTTETRTRSDMSLPKSGLIELNRGAFWKYCLRVSANAKQRANIGKFPATIDAHDIDRLLVDQNWRCAISDIEFTAPGATAQAPFGPSLDRIEPALGYVPGNVRMVCNIVNFAMNEWGEEALRRLVREMKP